jgi:aspartyl protease family protein
MAELRTKLGTTMLIAAWVAIIALLTLAFSGFLDHKHNPNRVVETRYSSDGQPEVVLRRSPNGHYMANGKINGYEVSFLLDTGATDVAIPEQVANRIGLRAGLPMQARTANGVITVYATRLDSISLGEIEMHNIRASINPHMNDESILLGMSFLRHVEWVQRGNTLLLRSM